MDFRENSEKWELSFTSSVKGPKKKEKSIARFREGEYFGGVREGLRQIR